MNNGTLLVATGDVANRLMEKVLGGDMPEAAVVQTAPLVAAQAAPRAQTSRAVAPVASQEGAAPTKRRGRGPKVSSEAHEAELAAVEKVVKKSDGLAAKDVASELGIKQTKGAELLKKLKGAGRIFQGGEKRFARYAGTQAAAEAASLAARGKGASNGAAAPAARKRRPNVHVVAAN